MFPFACKTVFDPRSEGILDGGGTSHEHSHQRVFVTLRYESRIPLTMGHE